MYSSKKIQKKEMINFNEIWNGRTELSSDLS